MAVAPLQLVVAERVATAVYQRLNGDSALQTALGGVGRIQRDAIKQGTTLDRWCTFSVMAAPNTLTLDGTPLWATVSVLVKVLARFSTPDVSYGGITPAADRCYQLLQGWRATVNGVQVVRLRKTDDPYEPRTVEAGVTTLYLNQLFVSEAYPF